MRKAWVFVHFDGDESKRVPPDPPLLLPNDFPSFWDNSLHHSCHAFTSCISNLAASFFFFFWSSRVPHIHTLFPSHSLPPLNHFSSTIASSSFTSQHKSFPPFFSHHFSTLPINLLFTTSHPFPSLPLLSFLASFLPPLPLLTSSMLSIPPEEGANIQMLGSLHQRPCNVNHPASFDSNWVRHTIEPKTGIEFPGVLDSVLAKENRSTVTSEVLVGTGSRTITIIKIKSLKIYAFGFYIQPFAVCKKLGPKYASLPIAELRERRDFYEDLLREDIGMTVRLVVNCNDMKINSVRDAFEKSLRARLLKTNPETDFKCISTFSSYFTKDIPLPAGTVIDFRRTADGQLITEIGGNQIGAVQSKELCRAFFDMYIGEVPVSEQTKEEIGRNVGGIIRRC